MRAAGLAVVMFFLSVTAAADGPCETADTLRLGKDYDEAQKLYVAILTKDKNAKCAQDGVAAIATTRAEAGRHLDLAAIYESAADKETAKQESLEAARLGVLRSQPTAPEIKKQADPLAAARWLAAAGLHDEAVAKLRATADTAPPQGKLPNELRYLASPRIYYSLKLHAPTIALALVAAALLVLPVLRRTLHPRLKMEKFDDPSSVIAGGGTTLYLQQQLISLTRVRHGGGFRFVTSPLANVTVPATISTAIPSTFDWLKPLVSLLGIVDYRKCLTLTGCAHPAVDHKGAGLTVVLASGKKIISTTTLWQSGFGTIPVAPQPLANPDLSPYIDLAEPTAVWLLFQLFQVQPLKPQEIRRVMGTAHWASYALNAAAARAQGRSAKRSREMLLRAINIDPGNAAAHANLGLVLQGSAGEDEKQLRTAVTVLETARNKQRSEKEVGDPVFFTASYFTAYTRYALYVLTKDASELKKCCEELKSLMSVIARSNSNDAPERVRVFISGKLPTVDVMRIGVEAETGAVTPDTAHIQLLGHRDHANDETQYNLACTYSVLARLSKSAAEDLFSLNDALKHLAFALHLHPEHYLLAEGDPTLSELRGQRADEFAELIHAAKIAATPS